MFLCALVGPLFPPPPAPCLLYMPFLCVRLSCCCFSFFSVFAFLDAPARPTCAPCSSPCYPCPAALCPLSRLSPLPFSFSLSTLPVRLPSLSVPRCLSCVPPACSTPAPPPRPYPFPWMPPRSPPLTPSWLPGVLCVWGGCICGLDCGPVPTMRRMNTERTSGRRLSNSRRCICIVEPSRIAKVRTPLYFVGVPWRQWPPRPGKVNPSEQCARKLNVFNAAPSCHAESFAAMDQVGG